ncbi:MAG: PTS sugar transporter subunit IIA [Deltaproteobacteria bacterium]|nr:PTS sugar transporter subunit IIA [Deltaproteobacteria bacterium]
MAMVLTAGLIGGEIVSRLRLPRVTGWILTGIVLATLHLPGLEKETLKSFSPLTDFVLGYIAFTVGSHFNFIQLRNAGKRLLFLVAGELIVTPLMVIFAMWWIAGLPIEVAFVFAAIAVAGAPGTTVLVVREARARGVFVRTLIAAVALIDMIAVMLFVLVDTALGAGATIDGPGFIITSLPLSFSSLALAAGIGVAVAVFVILMTRAIVGTKLLAASLVAAIVISWGLAEMFQVSSILACTFVGMALGNLMRDKERAGEGALTSFGDILFTVFYVLAGMRLDFSTVIPMVGLVALFLGVRTLGKVLSTFLSMSLAKSLKSTRNYLGIALLPHGGVAVGLMFFAQDDPALAQHAETILAVGLAALAINQLIGPSATRFALAAVGETGTDRPRLLDFIREQDIVTNFKASSKEDAIRQLVDVLYRTHAVNMDKQAFLTSVIERDHEESTCLGDGVMIPHGVLDDADASIVGAMALSADGLDFGAPDGRPVHAVVLLATPPAERHRHLEVLAAFAKAIIGDRNVAEQLFHARSAAHAYDILHADVAEDFNYFFEDTLTADDSQGAPVRRIRRTSGTISAQPKS